MGVAGRIARLERQRAGPRCNMPPGPIPLIEVYDDDPRPEPEPPP
jgi:hypothetical protein